MSLLRLGIAVLLVSSLAACAPAATSSSNFALATNEGRRMDLVLEESVNQTNIRRDISTLAQSVWSQSPELRSWFMMVDRVSDASNTLIMTASLDSASTSRSGSMDLPFVGRVTVMQADVTISVTLIDPITGVLLASATGNQSVGDTSEDRAMDAALYKAMEEAFYRATNAYAGGS